MAELSNDMRNWVNMLETLLSKDKTTAPSIANIPIDQIKQRDETTTTAATATPPPTQGALQQASQQQESQIIQNLLQQYPSLQESMNPLEHLPAPYDYMSQANLQQNPWSSAQYQTNPVFPYQKESFQDYAQKDNTGSLTQQNQLYQQSQPVTVNMPVLEPNTASNVLASGSNTGENWSTFGSNTAGSWSAFGSSADKNYVQQPGPASQKPSELPVAQYGTQISQPAVAQYQPAYYMQNYALHENTATLTATKPSKKPTVQSVRPWPTPHPFTFNKGLKPTKGKAHGSKSKLKGNKEKQLPSKSLPSNSLPVKSIQPNLLPGNSLPSRQFPGKTLPAVRINPFIGSPQMQDTRLHPWPFGLKIKVIPPEGGNYIMRIKGPLDTFAGESAKEGSAQGRSKGTSMNSGPAASYQSNAALSSQHPPISRYIAPMNRNYKVPPSFEQDSPQNPMVYLKVPRNHQKYIELTTQFPNNAKDNSTRGRSRDKIVSMKLPFNVSLATVLKNIYDNMFVNYLNRKPSEIIEDAESQRNLGETAKVSSEENEISATEADDIKANDPVNLKALASPGKGFVNKEEANPQMLTRLDQSKYTPIKQDSQQPRYQSLAQKGQLLAPNANHQASLASALSSKQQKQLSSAPNIQQKSQQSSAANNQQQSYQTLMLQGLKSKSFAPNLQQQNIKTAAPNDIQQKYQSPASNSNQQSKQALMLKAQDQKPQSYAPNFQQQRVQNAAPNDKQQQYQSQAQDLKQQQVQSSVQLAQQQKYQSAVQASQQQNQQPAAQNDQKQNYLSFVPNARQQQTYQPLIKTEQHQTSNSLGQNYKQPILTSDSSKQVNTGFNTEASKNPQSSNWNEIYQKLKGMTNNHFSQPFPNVPEAAGNPLRQLSPGNNEQLVHKASSPFPDSIHVRIYPGKTGSLETVTKALMTAGRQNLVQPVKPGQPIMQMTSSSKGPLIENGGNGSTSKQSFMAHLLLEKSPSDTAGQKGIIPDAQKLPGSQSSTQIDKQTKMREQLKFFSSLVSKQQKPLLTKPQVIPQMIAKYIDTTPNHQNNPLQYKLPLKSAQRGTSLGNHNGAAAIIGASQDQLHQNQRITAEHTPLDPSHRNLLPRKIQPVQISSKKQQPLIKFGPIKIPYRYLKKPFEIGPKLRLVPVRMETTSEETKEGKNIAHNIKPFKDSSLVSKIQSAGDKLAENNKQKMEYHLEPIRKPSAVELTPLRQGYAKQIQIMRALQGTSGSNNPSNQMKMQISALKYRSMPTRKVEAGKGSEVVGISATISPIRQPQSYAIASKTAANAQTDKAPIADRLNHNYPPVKGNSDKVNINIGRKQATDQRQQAGNQNQQNSGKIQTNDQRNRNNLAQAKAEMLKKQQEEKARIAQSSKMLSNFLKENSQVHNKPDDWDKRKSMIPPTSTIDSDLVSKSNIPHFQKMPISDKEIQELRKNHLDSRLTELKRKRKWTQMSSKTGLNKGDFARFKRT